MVVGEAVCLPRRALALCVIPWILAVRLELTDWFRRDCLRLARVWVLVA